MNILTEKVPSYLYEKANLIRLVLFTAIFALVFINIYKPFNSEHWYNVSELMFFVYSSLVILTGVLVVVVSRIILYFYVKKHAITYGQYGVWILFEIFFMALFYTVYVLSIRDHSDILKTFKESVTNTSLILLFPYAILLLYFSWREKERRLQRMEEDKQAGGIQKPNIIPFYDEKGELRLSVPQEHLLYIESADNYVIIWYLNKNVASRFVLRSTLKALEERLEEAHVLRCHRSYLVNFDRIKIIRREREGVNLDLGVDGVPNIPISKTYSEKITRHLF
jgi:DNA-binding LytR/AlgR family response regulator